MINLEKAQKEFKKYVNNYDIKNGRIKLKIKHSYKVMDVAEKISISLKLDEENIELAKLIALLHDIGRFEQLKIYDTCSDKDSIDHADLGVKILFKDNLIRKFIEENKYDDIIYKAIKNHNKYSIEEGLNEQELLHAKIIRDADKTDIYRLYILDIEKNENFLYNYDKISKEQMSDKILRTLEDYKLVNSYEIENEADKYAKALAFIFDYNFRKGIEIVKEERYIEKMINRVKTKENCSEWEKIQRLIDSYIDERLK